MNNLATGTQQPGNITEQQEQWNGWNSKHWQQTAQQLEQ
jgi:hypothetical protein